MNKQLRRQNTNHQPITLDKFVFFKIIFLIPLWFLWPASTYAQDSISFSESNVWIVGLDSFITSLAWGDMNGDGALDLAIGTVSSNVVYLNEGNKLQETPIWFSDEKEMTEDIAWGDVDGDGDLDLAVGNSDDLSNRDLSNKIYLNESGILQSKAIWSSLDLDNTWSIAWGDVDGDGDLDLAVGNLGEPNRVYANESGILQNTPIWSSQKSERTYSVAWGDADGDGDLDLAVGNVLEPSHVYLNEDGSLHHEPIWSSSVGHFTQDLDWIDIDNDDDLDLVIADINKGCYLYLNDGVILQSGIVEPFTDNCRSITTSDVDNDGDIDLTVSKDGKVYFHMNEAGKLIIGKQLSLNNGFPIDAPLAWGDVDGDGDLDLATIVGRSAVRVYLNEGSTLSKTAKNLFSNPDEPIVMNTTGWGDINGDGNLDLATTTGSTFDLKSTQTHLNILGELDYIPSWNPNLKGNTSDLAWGDVDNDGDLDLAVANSDHPNFLYINQDKNLQSGHIWISEAVSETHSLAWGDVDGDGDLDLAVGNYAQPNQLYLNEGGILQSNPAWSSNEYDTTQDIAWGDVDNDGDLDLAVANSDSDNNKLYINDKGILQNTATWSSAEDATDSTSVVWGDVDGDGDLDLAIGNNFQYNYVYFNNSGSLSENADWFSWSTSDTSDLSWHDIDGDGDLDLTASNSYYRNNLYLNQDGVLDRNPVWPFNETTGNAVSWIDIDNNGAPDLVVNDGSLYLNLRKNKPNGLAISSIRPHPSMAGYYAQAQILTSTTIPLTYTLYGPSENPVGSVRAEYSLNGGGQWFHAVPTTDTITSHLTGTPLGTTHIYTWDTFASGFFGQSDNVVIRMIAHAQPVSNTVAISGTYRYTNTMPGPLQQAYTPSTSYPFRVQGTRIRVYDKSIESGQVISHAIVYRMPNHQQIGQIMTNLQGIPYETDNNGYLQGRGQLAVGDRLIALLPMTSTTQYTAYKTSAAPNRTGLDTFEMTDPGVQELIISDNMLTIFKLSISLEWDARKDLAYLQQLESDLQRTSDILYDVTNGQAALGQVTIYHARKQWNEADVRIYATNRLRPHATIGGLNRQLHSATLTPSGTITETITKVYAPGQVHMPVAWNRTGDPTGNLGEDWPRTLVHELGHYFFYLLENYMGLDEHNLPRSVTTCPGIMGNVYLTANSELHPERDWLNDCAETLQHQTMGRSDWETIQTFYPWFDAQSIGYSDQNAGPTTLPLAITHINFVEPEQDTDTLDVATYYLIDSDRDRYNASSDAKAYLFKENSVIDLGQPNQDRLQVWGAELSEKDRICVYDLGTSTSMSGCKGTADQVELLEMRPLINWQPDVVVTAITSRTLTLKVTNPFTDGLNLQARLYPAGGDNRDATTAITMTNKNDSYLGIFSLINPPREARIHLWVDEDLQNRREAIFDYKLNGAPVFKLEDYVDLKVNNGSTLMLSDGSILKLEGTYIVSGDGNAVILSDGSTLMLSNEGALKLTKDSTLELAGDYVLSDDGKTFGRNNDDALNPSDGGALRLSDGGIFTLNDGSALGISDGSMLTVTLSSGVTVQFEGYELLENGTVLRLSDGGVLRLSDGGVLRLSDGGVLRLSDGGVLRLSDGGALRLSDGSVLRLSDGGALRLSDGSVLRLSDGGVLRLSDGGALTLEDGSTLQIVGNYELLEDDTAIRLSDGGVLRLSDGGVLRLSDGGVLRLSDGGVLRLSDGGVLRLSDGGVLRLSDGGTMILEDGNALSTDGYEGNTLQLRDGNSFLLSDGNGPVLSSDGQVQIFGRNLNFAANEFHVLQSIVSLPDVPLWTTVVGQGYRLTSSEKAPELAGNSISFRYLGRDVPAGEEGFLNIYHYDGAVWSRLETTIDPEQNFAVSPTNGEGVYVLMSTIGVPLDGPGWVLFGYPIQASRSVTEALLSIEGDYRMIYTYELTDVDDPWKAYDVNAPDYANDLTELAFARGYWIYLSKSVTAYFKGNTETANPSGRSQRSVNQSRPSTFYGQFTGNDNFEPEVDMMITAWINGVQCGQDHIQESAGQLVYTINVHGDSAAHPGCGTPDAEVIFQIDKQLLTPSGIWDNNQLWALDLRIPDRPSECATTTPNVMPTMTPALNK